MSQKRIGELTTNETPEAHNQKELLFKQALEIEEFKAKRDALLTEGYNPIVDIMEVSQEAFNRRKEIDQVWKP